jgi:peptidoglycan/LPS O-acetylase OafA/YrhL
MVTVPNPAVFAKNELSRQRSSESDARPNLDVLRAVAVLLVVFSHLAYYLGIADLGPFRIIWMGGVGVYFFFVHTCFVLMLSLERQWKGQGAPKLFVSFMVRRIFRIYPLSITVVVLIAAFGLPQATLVPGHFDRAQLSVTRIVENLLLVQGSGESLLGVMWSLPYEMAMYIFLPWIFAVLYVNRSFSRVVAMWFLSICGCVIALAYMGWPHRDYFFMYIPCFLPGVIAYQIQRSRRPTLPSQLWPCVILVMVPLFIVKQTLVGDYRIKSWLVCLLLGVTTPFCAEMSAGWITKPAHYIAKYSYGIYLTHYFCIWLAFEYLHSVLPRTVRMVIFAVLVTGIPILLYSVLEEPSMRLGRWIAKHFENLSATRSQHEQPVST